MNRRRGVSRRQFVRYAAAGAASICLSGCAALGRRREARVTPIGRGRYPRVDLIDREAFGRLVEVALNTAQADHTWIVLRDRKGGRTDFGLEGVRDRAERSSAPLRVRVAFGQQEGEAVAERLNAEGVVAAVRAAEERARGAATNPDALPPLPAQRPYLVLPTYRAETAAAGRGRRVAAAEAASACCAGQDVLVSGDVATYAEAVGVAADAGLFAFEQRTHAGFRLTVRGSECAGHAANIHRSIDDLGILAYTRVAIRRAKLPAYRAQFAPGRYTAVLGPRAVARLVQLLLAEIDAGADREGAGRLREKLGVAIIDRRLTLQNRPQHPDLLGAGFDLNGLPGDAARWIEHGVLKRVGCDQRCARESGSVPTYAPDAPYLSAETAECGSLDDLVGATRRGILVSDIESVAYADRDTLTLTGMTGDDTALIENGAAVAGLGGLRWRGTLLGVLNAIEMCTPPCEAVADDVDKLLVPALVVGDFACDGAAS